MVLDEINDALMNRRNELTESLNGSSLEKQHQLYGAINEIDMFLHTLSYHTEKNKDSDIEFRLVKPLPQEKDMFTKILDKVKKKVNKNKK
jgi:hypothetical protein